MPGAVTDEIEILQAGHGGGGGDVPAGGDDDGGSGRRGPRVPERAYYTGVQLALAGIIMFFMALTSSFLVRKGLGNDWIAFALPPVIWVNTLMLLASSATLEIARSNLRHEGDLDAIEGFRRWWGITIALGLVFLGGQLLVWRELAAQGVFLSSNPSSSFFYLLTALHGLHLIGGVIVLLYVRFKNWGRSPISQSAGAGLAAIYWHFLSGLWVFLLALLYLGR